MPEEEIAVLLHGLDVVHGDVLTVDDKLHVRDACLIPVQRRGPTLPLHQRALGLHVRELRLEDVHLHLHETRELTHGDGGVELEVGAERRELLKGAHLRDETLELRAVRLLVVVGGGTLGVRGATGGGRGGDKFGAREGEELVERGHDALAHPRHVVAVLLAQRRHYTLLEQPHDAAPGVRTAARRGAAQGHRHGDERVHVFLLLEEDVQRVRPGRRHLVPVDEHEARVEVADGVGVSAEHKVREPDVVRGGHGRAGHLGEDTRLVEVDGVENLERGGVVPEEDVHAVEADEGEIAQRAEDVGLVVVVPLRLGELLLTLAFLVEERDDARLVDERLEEVQHAERGPDLVAVLERREFLLGLDGELAAVLAHGLELVDELVDHLPEPEVGKLHVDVAVEDHAEQVAVVLPALLALVERRGGLAVHVPEVQLLVQQAKDVIVVGVPRDRLGAGPGGRLEVALGDGGEGFLVHGQDLVH